MQSAETILGNRIVALPRNGSRRSDSQHHWNVSWVLGAIVLHADLVRVSDVTFP